MSKSRTVGRVALALGTVLALAAPQAAFASTTTVPAKAPPAPPAIAPVNPGLSGYYELTLAPGGTADEAIRVINAGTVPAAYEVYATNATTSEVTGVSYGAENDHTGTATWVDLTSWTQDYGHHLSYTMVGANTVSVLPGTAVIVHFKVTVPAGTGPGQWVGGISAQAAPSAAKAVTGVVNGKQVGAGITVVTRSLVAIVVDVPGPAHIGLTIGNAQLITQNDAEQVINIPLNGAPGQLLFKPSLQARLDSCKGTSVLSFNRQLDTFVPRTSIEYPWYLKNILPAGCYQLATTVSNGNQVLDSRTSDFSIKAAQTVLPKHNAVPVRTIIVKQSSNEVVLILGGGILVLLILLAIYLIVRERSPKGFKATGAHHKK